MGNEILGDYDAVVANINRGLSEAGIGRHELTLLDHLCYRTESLDVYHQKVKEFSALGRNLGEMVVERRPIATIALKNIIETGGWVIPFLEIAAPKEGSPYPEGLEHAEFVTVKLVEDFAKDHEDLEFKTDAMDRPINPELKLRSHGISVKFHQLSLGASIEAEKKLGLTY